MLLELIQNKVILSCFFAWFISQILKLIINLIKNKEIKLNLLITTGRMPSSHSALVAALSTAMYLTEGLSSFFIIALVFSIIVIRDSLGIRMDVQENTKLLNKIIEQFNIKNKKLNEFIGHNILEVIVGILIGIFTTILIFT